MIWGSKGIGRRRNAPHAHDMHELFVCLNDHGVQWVDGQRHPFSHGTAFFLPQGSSHWIECLEDRPGEFSFLCFDCHHFLDKGRESVQKLVDELVTSGERASLGADGTGERNAALMEWAQDELKEIGPMAENSASSLLELMLINFRRGLVVGLGTGDVEDEGDDAIFRLCQRVKKSPESRISLDEAARAVAMSRTAFVQSFKRRLGMTWVEFVQDVRVKRAMELMCHSDLPTTQIAYESGFNHLGYFHRLFKRFTGRTPKAFRRQVAMKGFAPPVVRLRG